MIIQVEDLFRIKIMMKNLLFDICPPIVTNAPEDYVELTKECWHSDPNKRPTTTD